MIFIWDINNDYKQSKNNEYTKIAHSAIVSSTTQNKGLKGSLTDPYEFRKYLWTQVLSLWEIDQYNHLNSNPNIKVLTANLAIEWLFTDDKDYPAIEDLCSKLSKWKLENGKGWNNIDEATVNKLITSLINKMEYNLRVRINKMLENAETQLSNEGIHLKELKTRRFLSMITTSNKDKKMFKFIDVIKKYLEQSTEYANLVKSLKRIHKVDLGFIHKRYIELKYVEDGQWKANASIKSTLNYFTESYYKRFDEADSVKIRKFNAEQKEQLSFRKKELKWNLKKGITDPVLINKISEVIDSFKNKNDIEGYIKNKKTIVKEYKELKESILELDKKTQDLVAKMSNIDNKKVVLEYDEDAFNNLVSKINKIKEKIKKISNQEEYKEANEEFNATNTSYENLLDKAEEAKKTLLELTNKKNELKASLKIIKENLDAQGTKAVIKHFKNTFENMEKAINEMANISEYGAQNREIESLKENIEQYKILNAKKVKLIAALNRLQTKTNKLNVPNIKKHFKNDFLTLLANMYKIENEENYNFQVNELNELSKRINDYGTLNSKKIELNKTLDSLKNEVNNSRIPDKDEILKDISTMKRKIKTIKTIPEYKKQVIKLNKIKDKFTLLKKIWTRKVELNDKLDNLKQKLRESKIPGVLDNKLFTTKFKSIKSNIDSYAIENEIEYNKIGVQIKGLESSIEKYKTLWYKKKELTRILKSREKKLTDSGIEDAIKDFDKENAEFSSWKMRDNINSIKDEKDYGIQIRRLEMMGSKIDKYIFQKNSKVKIKGKTYTIDKNVPIFKQDKILGILAAGLLSNSLNGKKDILPGIDSQIFKRFLNEHKNKKEKLVDKIKNQIKDKLKNGELGRALKESHGKNQMKKIQSLINLYSKKGGDQQLKNLYDGKNLDSLLKTRKGQYVKEVKEALEHMNVDALKNVKKLYENERISKETFEKLKKKLEDHKNIIKQIWDRTNPSAYKKWFAKILKEMDDLKVLKLNDIKKIPKWLKKDILKGINATTQLQIYASYGIGVISASIAALCSFIALNFLKFKKKGLVNIKSKKGLVTTSLIIGIISMIISIGAFLNGGGII